MTAFILRERTKLPPEEPLPEGSLFDKDLQLWVQKGSREPIVLSASKLPGSNFGETVITAAREGIDPTNLCVQFASQFGETTMTKTFEGADQGEGPNLGVSVFGEPAVNRSREGTDQTGLSTANGWTSTYAPYTHL